MLPNPHCAFVEEKKIRRYLLNPDHSEGRTKATFFLARGASAGLMTKNYMLGGFHSALLADTSVAQSLGGFPRSSIF